MAGPKAASAAPRGCDPPRTSPRSARSCPPRSTRTRRSWCVTPRLSSTTPSRREPLAVDHIGSLTLFYLRATSRPPQNAGIGSCTIVHLCEAFGLHYEESIVMMAATPTDGIQWSWTTARNRMRRLFWIVYAGSKIMSYEYDRSAAVVRRDDVWRGYT
ncbi:hypothetical protein MY10362_004947 [Beauveria mimosiformis]